MHSPTMIVLSVVVSFLTCSDTNPNIAPLAAETPLQVVREYVSLSREGKFDKLESVTVVGSAEQKKIIDQQKKMTEQADAASSPSNTSSQAQRYTVVPDEKAAAEGGSDWVNDFARSIHDEKLSIKSVRKESANETEARVEAVLGNEKVIHSLGWVFLLRKVDEKWKIYNITTPGDTLEPLR